MIRNRDFLVGVVFLLGLVIIGYMTISIQDFGATFFGKKYPPISVDFDRVSGLREGDPVRAKGFQVGKVRSIDYRADGQIRVMLSLERPVSLHSNAIFQIQSSSPLGGRHVEILPGEGERVQRRHFTGEEATDFWQLIADLLQENRYDIAQSFKKLRQILEYVEGGEGFIGDAIKNPQLKDQVREIVADIRKVSGKVARDEGLLHDIMTDDSVTTRNVRDFSAKASAVATKINEGDNLVARLLNDKELSLALKNAAERIDKGEGLLGHWIRDKALRDDFSASVKSARGILGGGERIVHQIEDGKGTVVSGLLYSDEWGGKVDRSLGNVEEITQKVNKGPGTVSRLINESELIDDVSHVFTLFRESIEDAREQAPINTIVTGVVAAF